MRGFDPKRLSLHAGTLRPMQRFEDKADLAARAGFGAWALRGVELEGYLADGRTIADECRFNKQRGLAISETGSLDAVAVRRRRSIPEHVSAAARSDGRGADIASRPAPRMDARARMRPGGGDCGQRGRRHRGGGGPGLPPRVCQMAARHRLRVALEVPGFAPASTRRDRRGRWSAGPSATTAAC